jgi:hypothetical protein
MPEFGYSATRPRMALSGFRSLITASFPGYPIAEFPTLLGMSFARIADFLTNLSGRLTNRNINPLRHDIYSVETYKRSKSCGRLVLSPLEMRSMFTSETFLMPRSPPL